MASKAEAEYTRINALTTKTPLDLIKMKKLEAIIAEEVESEFNPDGMTNRVNKLVMAQMGASLSEAEAKADITEKFAKPIAMMDMVKRFHF